MNKIKSLFIDIDGTLVDCLKEVTEPNPMFTVLFEAAKQEGKLPEEEITKRIHHVKHFVHWWHWADFIVALELNPKKFWDFAYEFEKEYMLCSGKEIPYVLNQLKSEGYGLYITSNNPNCGILHKLRLIGLGTNQAAPLFNQLLGCQEMKGLKWDLYYWKNALAHTGLDGEEVATIGDDLKCDGYMPLEAGISRAFIVNRKMDVNRKQENDRITIVKDFNEILQILKEK